MDLKLLLKGFDFDFSSKRKKRVLLFAASGLTAYAIYKVYHLPFIAHKRKRALKLLGAFGSLVEAVSASAETIGLVSNDLKQFLNSDCDQIPNSLNQIGKIMVSNELSKSVVNVTRALTLGVLLGFQGRADAVVNSNSDFVDKVMDKLFTTAGSGFASVVIGSFARNLVLEFYSSDLENNSVSRLVNVVFSDEKCREVIGDCTRLFVSTMVAVYLDKTMHINTFDEFFAGLTNPKHEAKVRDVLVDTCNGAVESLVKTSHRVLTSSDSCTDSQCNQNTSGKISCVLSEPSNRELLLDVTGRITFEMVRSFLEVLVQKLCDGLRKCVDVVQSGVEVVSYVATVCVSLYLQIFNGVWTVEPIHF